MTSEQNFGTCSASVEMRRLINSHSISITYPGLDFVLLRATQAHPLCGAIGSLQLDESAVCG
jgi:hypothetical protein